MQRDSALDREFELDERVRVNQQRLRAALQPGYDFIVCGAGTSGSVIARRLAENPDAQVLLLEAGGSDGSVLFPLDFLSTSTEKSNVRDDLRAQRARAS